METVTLVADTSQLALQCKELSSLALEAGNIPESILRDLRDLLHKVSDELVFCSDTPAIGAGKLVVSVRFREGGKFDLCAAALRALCNRGNDVQRIFPLINATDGA